MRSWYRVLLLACLVSLLVSPITSPVLASPSREDAVPSKTIVEITPETVYWQPQTEYARAHLKIRGPNDLEISKEFLAGTRPELTMDQGGRGRLPDGYYVYELSLISDGRNGQGPTPLLRASGVSDAPPGELVTVESGAFLVVDGAFAQQGKSDAAAHKAYSTQSQEEVVQAAAPFLVDFEQLSDFEVVTNQYAGIGVTFSGAIVLSQGQSLNSLSFPPKSGIDVIYDDPDFTDLGTITAVFNQSLVQNVSKVGAYVTGNRNITMSAYDSNNNVVGIDNTGGANYVSVGTPNKLLQVAPGTSIAYVKFTNGGEKGNTYTVDDFFFESSQSCQISGIPLYKQGGTAEWANDAYGGSADEPWKYDDDKDSLFDEGGKDTPETIAKWGCALTSAAMVVSYHGLQQNGFTTTPRLLNTWLRTHNGYSQGSIIWDRVAAYARQVGGMQLYYYAGWGPNDGVVNGYVCNSAPIILDIRSSPYLGHYVVATGQVDEDTWTVNDPGGFNITDRSTNQYSGYRKYATSAKEPQWLYVAVHSPITLIITDPAGRRTGYDPATGEFVNEILDATYNVEVMEARDESDSMVETVVFETGSPLSGAYSVQVNGTGAGSYRIDFMGVETNGEQKQQTLSGALAQGTTFYLGLNYDASSGSPFELTVPENLPPVASAGGPYVGLQGFEVILDASQSSDPEGQPLAYRWDVNDDGIWDTEGIGNAQVQHTFDAPGQYDIRLEVADGLSTTTSLAVASIKAPFGPPALLQILVSPSELQADGSSEAAVKATVQDAKGVLIPDQTVEFTTSLGTIDDEALTDANGVATATLTAASVIGMANVSASAGAAVVTTTVRFVAGPPATIDLNSYLPVVIR